VLPAKLRLCKVFLGEPGADAMDADDCTNRGFFALSAKIVESSIDMEDVRELANLQRELTQYFCGLSVTEDLMQRCQVVHHSRARAP
jgi:hypothetical protein